MDVEFTSCEEAECSGEIDGAAYEILMPETWNGTLLLYSHGYRQAEAAPPSFEEPNTDPDPAPGYSTGDTRAADALLEQGYALAGSAYASNGWAVEDGVEAGEALHEHFVEQVGRPGPHLRLGRQPRRSDHPAAGRAEPGLGDRRRAAVRGAGRPDREPRHGARRLLRHQAPCSRPRWS